MKPRIVVIGLGLFGREVAVSLGRHGRSVLAIDKRPEAVELVKDYVDQAVIMDATDEDALKEARIDQMEVAICAIGAQHVQNSILTTALLHQLKIPRIIARAADALQARILRQVGATEIANPEKEMGQRLANRIASPGLREVLNLVEGAGVAEILVPPSLVGQTLAGLDFRRKHGVTVVAVEHRTGEAGGPDREAEELPVPSRRLMLSPEPTRPFEEGDALVVIGDQDKVRKLQDQG